MNDASDPFEDKANSNKTLQVIKRVAGIVGGDRVERSMDLVAELLGLQLDLLDAVNTKLTRMIKADFNVGLSNLQDSLDCKGEDRIDCIKAAIQNFKFAEQKNEQYEVVLALFFEGTCHQLLNHRKIALRLYKKAYQYAHELQNQLIYRLEDDPGRLFNFKKKDVEMQLQQLKVLVPYLEELSRSGWNKKRLKKAIQLQKELLHSSGKIPGVALIPKQI